MADDTATQPETEMTEQEMDAYFENEGFEEEAPETEETPEEEPLPEAAEKPEEKPPEKEEEKYVPLNALHEERARRKELTQKLNSMEARFQEMLDRMKAPEEPQPPALDENPVGNLDERIRRAEEALAAQNKQTQAAQNEQQFLNAYRQDAERFAQEQADFGEAYSYWQSGRAAELQAMGMPPQQAGQIIRQEEAAAAFRAMQSGESPAQRIYEAAKARGYKKAEPEKPKPDIQTIDKGQRASRSLSQAGGKAPEADSLEALAAMDDEEFDKNFERIIANYR